MKRAYIPHAFVLIQGQQLIQQCTIHSRAHSSYHYYSPVHLSYPTHHIFSLSAIFNTQFRRSLRHKEKRTTCVQNVSIRLPVPLSATYYQWLNTMQILMAFGIGVFNRKLLRKCEFRENRCSDTFHFRYTRAISILSTDLGKIWCRRSPHDAVLHL